jgi:hypothetical protein
VSSIEFEAFLRYYPQALEARPPMSRKALYREWFDVTLGDWPGNVVARGVAGAIRSGLLSGAAAVVTAQPACDVSEQRRWGKRPVCTILTGVHSQPEDLPPARRQCFHHPVWLANC